MGTLTRECLTQKSKSTLYHYTNQSGLIGILNSKTLWASKMQYLNDASEFSHALKVANRVVSGKKESAGSDEIKLLENVEEALLMLSYAHIFVGCLSEAGDLLSQWRGYCPTTNGFSIGFDPGHLHSALARQGFVLAPCIYDEQKQEVLVKELLGDALHFPETLPENVFSPERNPGLAELSKHWGQRASVFVRDFLGIGPLFKHDTFREENEWRVLCSVIPDRNPDFRIRPGKSMLIPYREIKLDSEDGLVHLDELIVGPTPHTQLATQAARNLLNSLYSNGIRIKNVRPSRIPYRAW